MASNSRKSKWFTKAGKVKHSTAPVDHVQFRHEGWTQHDTEEAAKVAAAAHRADAGEPADEAPAMPKPDSDPASNPDSTDDAPKPTARPARPRS